MTTPSSRRALVVIGVQNEYFEGGGLPIEHSPIAQNLPPGAARREDPPRLSVVLHSNFAAVASTTDWIAAVQSGRALPRNILMPNRRVREHQAA